MVCCNCLPNRERQPTAVPRTGSHNRNATTLTDITWHVGVGYALFRQIIFLTNALQIGCAMSLVAAVVQQSSSDVGEWLGTTVYLIIMAVAGTILLTALLGCTGSCYQSQVTLIVYIVVLFLLILAEGTIIFLITSSELDGILESNWKTLDDSMQKEIEQEFDCKGPEMCIDAARDEAHSMILLIYYISGGIALYQILMMIMTGCYIRGLRKKKEHIKAVKDPTPHMYADKITKENTLEEVPVDDLRSVRYGV